MNNEDGVSSYTFTRHRAELPLVNVHRLLDVGVWYPFQVLHDLICKLETMIPAAFSISVTIPDGLAALQHFILLSALRIRVADLLGEHTGWGTHWVVDTLGGGHWVADTLGGGHTGWWIHWVVDTLGGGHTGWRTHWVGGQQLERPQEAHCLATQIQY